MLVLKEEHGVVASDCGAQETVRVERRRRVHHAQARNVSEDGRATLRVIDRAAFQVASDRAANHERAFPVSTRAPAHQCKLVSNLVISWPDVVEELTLYDGLESTSRHAYGAAHYVGFRERRV